MSKYIDAEKLIAEIERFKATEYGDNTFGDDVANGALDYVLEEIIPSLQQKQPEVELEKASRNVYESWKGGTMDDFLRDMAELVKALNARKEK